MKKTFILYVHWLQQFEVHFADLKESNHPQLLLAVAGALQLVFPADAARNSESFSDII